ncbi:MAG TPA: OmpA family protein [Chitinophagaceae bacterium]|nr:OmpA family protein [Chitinophagaceae bacterium]
MKKIIFSLLALSLVGVSFAQTATTTSYKKRPTLSVNFFLKDFKTPDRIGGSSLASVLNNKQWAKPSEMTPGISVGYFEGLSEHVDFMANLGGTFVDYPFLGRPKLNSEKFLVELDANVNLKLVSDKYAVVPFLSAGAGISMHGGNYFGAFIPVGGGLQIKLGDEGSFLFTQMSYRIPVTTTNVNYNMNYSLGFGSPLVEKKEPPVKVIPPMPPKKEEPKDTDKDGIVDSLDKCPTVAGIAKYKGCPIPDTDKDGINDEQDKCPTVAGLAKYQGCPIPDTDKDGINDEEDKCPTVAGLARYQGCPIPDTDKDGINDEEDKCPTIAGPASNNGCPVLTEEKKKAVELAAKDIYFVTGSSVIQKKSYTKLDAVLALLKDEENKTLSLDIEGYTDNTGKASSNLKLSQARANAVKAYLVKKGIAADRLSATGFGIENPVADNKTAAGRAQNRRVELKLKEN